jgi:uncharacterized protein with PIN domain
MPKCIECNEELERTDCSDFELYSTNEVITAINGICPICKKEYYWQEIYKFKRFEKLEEIT